MIQAHETIVDSEGALVGSLLIRPEQVDLLPALLAGGDFSNRDLGACFDAIIRRHRAGQPISGPLVSSELSEAQADVLEEAAAAGAMAYHVEYLAQAVLAAGVRRQLVANLASVVRVAGQSPPDPYDLLTDIARISEAAQSRLAGASDGGGVGVSEGLTAVLARAEAAGRGETAGILTGLPSLDYYTGGLQRGCTTVVGARTSLGKSALTGQIAVNAAHAGSRAVLFSFEMSAFDFYRRFAATATGINGVLIREGRLGRSEWSTLTAACNDLEQQLGDRLQIYDRLSRDVGVILATARRLHRQGKLDLLVIDFLQKLRIGREVAKNTNRNAELEQISGALADLARELQVPLVIGSQLNRAAEGVRPGLANLRDSGTIEQDADIVLLIHGERESLDRELIILKNRDGRCGSIPVRFDPDRLVFAEPSERLQCTGNRN